MFNANSGPPEPVPVVPPKQFSFLRLRAVLKRRGLSRSSHYADIRAGLYTRGVPIGQRAVAYPDYEVDLLNAARIAGNSDDEVRSLVLKLHAARCVAMPA